MCPRCALCVCQLVEDLTVIAAMTLPSGGRNDIPARLKRHFYTLCLSPPSLDTLETIYGRCVDVGRIAPSPASPPPFAPSSTAPAPFSVGRSITRRGCVCFSMPPLCVACTPSPNRAH
jgi:hypothetical protein